MRVPLAGVPPPWQGIMGDGEVEVVAVELFMCSPTFRHFRAIEMQYLVSDLQNTKVNGQANTLLSLWQALLRWHEKQAHESHVAKQSDVSSQCETILMNGDLKVRRSRSGREKQSDY